MNFVKRRLIKRTFDISHTNFATRFARQKIKRDTVIGDTFDAMDSLFSGFIAWGQTNGTDGSVVPQPTDDGTDPWNLLKNYRENFLSPMAPDNSYVEGAGGVFITQPCNYVSNVAYYYSAISLCHGKYKDFSIDRETVLTLASAFFTLGSGSAFFHGR